MQETPTTPANGTTSPHRPLRTPAEQDSGQRLVPLGSFRRRRSELIRVEEGSKVRSEVSASVAGKLWIVLSQSLHPCAEHKTCGVPLGPRLRHSGLVLAGGADGAGNGALWA